MNFLNALAEMKEKVEERMLARPTLMIVVIVHQTELGDLVFLTTHALSKAAKGVTKKFMPLRDPIASFVARNSLGLQT